MQSKLGIANRFQNNMTSKNRAVSISLPRNSQNDNWRVKEWYGPLKNLSGSSYKEPEI